MEEQRLNYIEKDQWILQQIEQLLREGDYNRASIVAQNLAEKLKAQFQISKIVGK